MNIKNYFDSLATLRDVAKIMVLNGGEIVEYAHITN